jgi:hypothetical protein
MLVGDGEEIGPDVQQGLKSTMHQSPWLAGID